MDKQKILVVDDEKHIRMLYQEELEEEGYEVATSDGEEPILDLLDREQPRVVILDIRLGPERSGLDLLQLIRSRDAKVPVILSTAYDSFQHGCVRTGAMARRKGPRRNVRQQFR